MRRTWLASLIVITTITLNACSTSSSESADAAPSTDSLVHELLTHCTDLSVPKLGPGKLCLDKDFRWSTDDFSFANWGSSTMATGNVTAQTLVSLFGHDAVCVASEASSCILRPAAIQKLEEWNTALNGGRCEGLATLSTRLRLGMESLSAYQPNARNTAELSVDNPLLNESIVRWWATQFLEEVTHRAAEARERSPLQLVGDLFFSLGNDRGDTIGMYQGTSGHSVTPFAITLRGDDFIIHVYDNNHPGKRFEIFVNSKTNTWRYPNAFHGLDGSVITWKGGTGSLELTPMSSRKGPFRCPFCTTSLATAPNVVTIASRDVSEAGFVEVTTDAGTFLSSPTGITNTISGATYSIGKGSTGGLITVTIPHAITDFDIRLKRESKNLSAADVVVGLRRSDGATLQVTGDLARDVLDDAHQSSALLSVHKDRTLVHAPSSNSAQLSLAAGSRITRRTLNAGEIITVRSISGNSIEVALKGAKGATTPFAKIPLLQKSETIELTMSIDDRGHLTFLPSRLEPVRVVVPKVPNFTPGKPNQTTRTTVPSIEISEPD